MLDRSFPFAILLCCLLLGWYGWSLFSFQSINGRANALRQSPSQFELKENADMISSGMFSLSGKQRASFSLGIFKELNVLAVSTRPDLLRSDPCIVLELNLSGQKKTLTNGEIVFLAHEDSDDGSSRLIFTNEKTPLCIRPLILDQARTLIECTFEESVARNSLVMKRQDQEIVTLTENKTQEKMAGLDYHHIISQGKFLGRDLLLEKYSGAALLSLKNKSVIRFKEGREASVQFVGAGDFLKWENREWKATMLDDACKGKPLARVKAIGEEGAEIEVWDESGFGWGKIHLGKEYSKPSGSKIENIFTTFRPKTHQQFSCLAGKRRILVREGDWLLKTQKGWRVIRRLSEVDGIINRSLNGELLIFDQVFQDENKLMIRGHWFDEARSVCSPVQWTVVNEQRSQVKQRKRRPSYLNTLGGKI